MQHSELIILSYHRFVEQESDYRFSRTYEQFGHDIRKKVYDLITIDDGMSCQIKACALMTRLNIRAKLFICTSLVGTKGYCTWDELRELSKYHDIENHSHVHEWHTNMTRWDINISIQTAQRMIGMEIGKYPRFFVAPYNQYNQEVDDIVSELGLISLKNRENILNISK